MTNKISIISAFYCILFTNIALAQLKYAFIREDNDYVLYKDVECNHREKIPLKVNQKIKTIIGKNSNGLSNESYAYKIIADSVIDIYVLEISNIEFQKAYFIAFNHHINIISIDPIAIDIKWGFDNENGFLFKMLDYPLIKVSKNGKFSQVEIKERVHNGNSYNAVLNKIYSLDNTMTFKLNYCYESSCMAYVFAGKESYIYRIFRGDSLFAYNVQDKVPVCAGYSVIDFDNFKVKNEKCFIEGFGNFLFTASGKNSEDFLRHGYSDQY